MKKLVVMLCLGSALIAGCNDPKEANEKNFRAALNEYLAKHPACIGGYTFPSSNMFRKEEFKALESAGLVTLVGKGKYGESTYDITNEGKKYFEKAEGDKYGRLCYAKVQVGEIKNFTQPGAMMGMTISEVAFTYKLDNIAPWGKNEDIQQSFLNVKKEMEGDQKDVRKKALVLTNKGWSVDL